MENSQSGSSNGSPNRPPAFFRLSSEVVEKPDTVSYMSDSEPEDQQQDMMRPVVLPNSPASTTSKSDNEGTLI